MRLEPTPDAVDPLKDTIELATVDVAPAVGDVPGLGRDRQVLLSERIGAALRSDHRSRPDTIRTLLLQLWDELNRSPGPELALARCLLAHQLAALQEEPGTQLRWNLRALQAGQLATDAELAAWGLPIPTRALFPLLHLRLAQTHHRAGDSTQARTQLHLAHTWAPALPDDSYGHRVRADMARLVDQLDLLTRPAGAHRR